jgi:hypothetical protein
VEREEILDAIRRCASSNGGVPVGRNRFTSMTGIAETQWLGRYWARWSDAVREAGYEPNVLQQAHDEDVVLERFAELIQELGHFPTEPEVRLKRRADQTFPSHNVFRRFGRRDGVARRIIELFGDRPGYEDVVGICEAIAVTAPAGTEDEAQQDAVLGPLSGEVYLMKSGANFKIGRSNATGRRAYELAIQLPERLEVVHVIETDDVVGIEAYWHRRFANRRLNGEWFALSKADVAAFKRLFGSERGVTG